MENNRYSIFWDKVFEEIFDRPVNYDTWRALTGISFKAATFIFEIIKLEDENEEIEPLHFLVLLDYLKNYDVLRVACLKFKITVPTYSSYVKKSGWHFNSQQGFLRVFI